MSCLKDIVKMVVGFEKSLFERSFVELSNVTAFGDWRKVETVARDSGIRKFTLLSADFGPTTSVQLKEQGVGMIDKYHYSSEAFLAERFINGRPREFR